MPLTIEHADLLQPAGMLTRDLFPDMKGEQLGDLLDAKLAAGYDEGAAIDDDGRRNKFAVAWAYSKAYLVIWQRLSAAPSVASIQGEGARTYTSAQVDTFAKLSAQYLADSSALLQIDTGITARTIAPAAKNVFQW